MLQLIRPREMPTNELFVKLGLAGVKERIPFYAQEGYRRAEEMIGFARNDVELPFVQKCNALGVMYPWFSGAQRDGVLDIFLKELDEWSYDHVENKMLPYIREPLLFSDIICARNYNHALESHISFLQDVNTRDDFLALINYDGLFKPEIEQEFLMTYAALRTDCSAHVYTALQHMNHYYLDRVVTGVANMCLHNQGGVQKIFVDDVKKFFPSEVHGKIWKAYNKKEWVSYYRHPEMIILRK